MVERRVSADRRRRRLQSFLYQFYKGRRIGERRGNHEGPHHYVDVHGAGLLLVILLILLMCIADSYFTLTLLHYGGKEVNPLMKTLIERDVTWFFYGKYLMTACSLIILLMHKNATLLGAVSGSQILFMILLAYAVLISYEIQLLREANLLLPA